jgi:hypothetical protein
VRILPGEDGVNRVVSRDIERNDREEAAMILGGSAGMQSDSVGVGGAVSGAGMAGYSMTSDHDNEAQFKFRCK